MADRYWVGGTDSWNSTAGTKWAATSGGAGGETVPTASDDVFFDANSSGTVTIVSTALAKSINCTGFTGTITGSGNITVSGSVTLDAGHGYTHSGTMTFTGAGTLTTAGKTFSGIKINNAAASVTLGDALNVVSTRLITVTRGQFDTANYNVTAVKLGASNTNARTISFGSSTVTLTVDSTDTALNFLTSTNLTFNAGTSQINLSGPGAILSGGSQTFYNVAFTSASAGLQPRIINGTNTFNDLSITPGAASSVTQLRLSDNQTINGTLTCAGASVTRRVFVFSDTLATARTITAASVSADNCDFRDITIAGVAAPISPSGAGDCGNNSGITFPAAKTVYRVGTNTTWVGSSSWALSSGGAGSDANFPLAQDTVVINNSTSLTGTLNFDLQYCNIGTINASARTTGITFAQATTGVSYYGSFALGSGVTTANSNKLQRFLGRGTTVFTSAGRQVNFTISIDAPGGTFQLGDAFTSIGKTISLERGTFDANNYNVTTYGFYSSNSNSRNLTMGSGLWTLVNEGTKWNFINTANLTFNKGTADILLSSTTPNTRTFRGGTLSYNKLTIGPATSNSVLTISDASSFTELASTATNPYEIRFGTNLGTIDTWSVSGASGSVVTVRSNNTGVRRTFTLTNSTAGTVDYLTVTAIGVTQPDLFYVGANSTDGGNNLNVIFADGPVLDTGNMFMMFH